MQSTPASNNSEARMMRGLEILQNKHIVENEDGSFTVPSQTSKNTYEVRLLGQVWACSCPDFEYREIDACKHIFSVRMFIAANTYLKEEPKPKVLADDAVSCKHCGSIRVIKYGIDSGKQTYNCKDCRARFVQDSLLKKARFTPELVCLTLDLYFSGLSLRKIARNISDHFDVDINYSTIYTWIQKYIPQISEYVNSLAPKELSDTWHADEIFVKLKGGEFHKSGARIGFVWNIMDRQTRFLLASKLTDERDKKSALIAFKEALANAHGLTPSEIRTDSLNSYTQVVKTTMPNAKHVANCGIRKQHANNNRIERLNGTVRERVKVQRGWKTVKTALAEGQRIQYNFVKPHMALEGRTPASAAGMAIKGWNDLLRNAIKVK
jgi:transposase-like protein